MDKMERKSGQNKFALALSIALDAHRDQTAKAGQPYIFHLLGVAKQATTDDEFIVGLLHDFVEDGKSGVRADRLKVVKDAFGTVISAAIDAISKKPEESRQDYITRVAQNKLATAVKFHDLANNSNPQRLQLLTKSEQQVLLQKYKEDIEQLNRESKKLFS